jgi:hypothetical protein
MTGSIKYIYKFRITHAPADALTESPVLLDITMTATFYRCTPVLGTKELLMCSELQTIVKLQYLAVSNS